MSKRFPISCVCTTHISTRRKNPPALCMSRRGGLNVLVTLKSRNWDKDWEIYNRVLLLDKFTNDFQNTFLEERKIALWIFPIRHIGCWYLYDDRAEKQANLWYSLKAKCACWKLSLSTLWKLEGSIHHVIHLSQDNNFTLTRTFTIVENIERNNFPPSNLDRCSHSASSSSSSSPIIIVCKPLLVVSWSCRTKLESELGKTTRSHSLKMFRILFFFLRRPVISVSR